MQDAGRSNARRAKRERERWVDVGDGWVMELRRFAHEKDLRCAGSATFGVGCGGWTPRADSALEAGAFWGALGFPWAWVFSAPFLDIRGASRYPARVVALNRTILAAVLAAGCDSSPRTTGVTPNPSSVASLQGAPKSPVARAIDGLTLVTGEAVRDRIRKSSARCTLVNVWASWCGSCKRELPMFVSLAKDLASEGVDVMLISVDDMQDQDKAVAFLKQQGASLPGLLAEGNLEPFKHALNPRWKGMIPATFLYDGDAKLRYFWGGPVFENEVLPIVQGFLTGAHIDGEARLGIAPGRVDR